MAPRPVKNAPQQGLALSLVREPTSEGRRFGCREICKLDTGADVERRHPRVADQVRGRRHPQQAEGETLERGIIRAAVVALADPGEELVRAERQAADGVDLVEEDDQLGLGRWALGLRRR